MIKKCEQCGKEYKKYNKPTIGRGSRRSIKRGSNTKTCSKECSKLYTRRIIKENSLKSYIKKYIVTLIGLLF